MLHQGDFCSHDAADLDPDGILYRYRHADFLNIVDSQLDIGLLQSLVCGGEGGIDF